MRTDSQQHRSIPCRWCHGTGFQGISRCLGCDGSGREYLITETPISTAVAIASGLFVFVAVVITAILAFGAFGK